MQIPGVDRQVNRQFIGSWVDRSKIVCRQPLQGSRRRVKRDSKIDACSGCLLPSFAAAIRRVPAKQDSRLKVSKRGVQNEAHALGALMWAPDGWH